MALKFDLSNAPCRLCTAPNIKTTAGSVVEKTSTLPSVPWARATAHHKGHSFKTATTNASSSCKPVHHEHAHQTCLCPQGSTLISSTIYRRAKNSRIKTLGGPSQENTAKICWLPTKYRPSVLCREKLLKRVPHLINAAQNLAPFFTKCREYGLKLLWDPWTETWAHHLWKQKQPAKKMRLFPPKKYHLI